MGEIQSTEGTRIFIGGTLAQKTSDFVSSDYTSQTWVEIAWAENLGQVGDQSSSVTFSAIADGRTRKLKGTRDAGEMALVFGVDNVDAGQVALIAAEKTKSNFAFKVEFADKPSAGTHGSQRFFIAQVMGAREQLDAVNNVIKLAASLAINSNIVKVAAV